jgi:Tol biopolymer transport system component
VGIACGAVTRLSDGLPGVPRVAFAQFTPDGQTVVFSAADTGTGSDRLWSVPLAGGPLTDLTTGFGPGADLIDVRISPDGQHVVYVASPGFGQPYSLWQAAADGSVAPQLLITAPLPAAFSVVVISPDSSTIAFRSDLIVAGQHELFTMPISGGGVSVVNDPISSVDGDVDFLLRFTPDSQRLLYIADQDANDVLELYSAPTTGGGTTKLNGTLSARRGVSGFDITPDGTTVVYRANERSRGSQELFAVPVTGGVPVRLNQDLPTNRDVVDPLISPDSTTVYYRASLGGPARSSQIFRVALTATAPPHQLTEATLGIGQMRLTPDGRSIVFSTQAADLVGRVHVVPTTSGPSRELSPSVAAAASSTVGVNFWALSPDGRWVVMSLNRADGTYELWRTPVAAGSPLRLDSPAVPVKQFNFFQISPRSHRVAFALGNGPEVGDLGSLYAVDMSLRCAGFLADHVGARRSESMVGTGRADVIVGLGGADIIRAGRGNDIVCGGSGLDTVRGGRGSDTLYGNGGRDRMLGGRGRDAVFGGAGADRLFGNGQPDSLVGGLGTDTCDSGPGPDTAVDCENGS